MAASARDASRFLKALSNRNRLLLLCLQPMWIAFAISTEQYGFVVGSVAYGLGQLNGFLRSRREVHDKEERP